MPSFARSGNPDTTISHVAPIIHLHVGAGFGILGFEDDAGIFYQNANTFVGIRYLRSHEMDFRFDPLGGSASGGDRPLESVWEIDTYVGQKFLDRDFTLSILAGVCVLGGVQRGKLIRASGFEFAPGQYDFKDEYQYLDNVALGIPVEARLGYTPWQYYDFGISYFVDINSRKTFSGLLISFRVLIPFISVAA